jgi:hypothetical protein
MRQLSGAPNGFGLSFTAHLGDHSYSLGLNSVEYLFRSKIC